VVVSIDIDTTQRSLFNYTIYIRKRWLIKDSVLTIL